MQCNQNLIDKTIADKYFMCHNQAKALLNQN